MNQKVIKARRDVERAERKLAELQAELKQLRSDRTKHEDAEIVRRIRAASAKSGLGIDELLAMLEPAPGTARTAQDANDDEESEVE